MIKLILLLSILLQSQTPSNQTPESLEKQAILAKPDAFETLVNPKCSHCVDEAKRRLNELKNDDLVLCWTRGYSEGGAIPIRFFLNKYRIISDSYGVFVYDPDAGYARGFEASYNFVFHGWRDGVMVMKDKSDSTIYSCLSGLAIDGPGKGKQLKSVPTILSTWGEVMQRNPNAVAYHMFEKYQPVELPKESTSESLKSRRQNSSNKNDSEKILGLVINGQAKAVSFRQSESHFIETFNGKTVVVIRDPKNDFTASAYFLEATQPRKWKAPQPNDKGVSPLDEGKPLPDGVESPNRIFKPEDVMLSEFKSRDWKGLALSPEFKSRDWKGFALSPEFKSRDWKGFALSPEFKSRDWKGFALSPEFKSSWGVDGRCQSGELKGWTLLPADSLVCTYRAWKVEYPKTESDALQATPATAPANANNAVKMVSGTAEFLRLLPKPYAIVKSVDAKNRTVTLLLEGEKVPKVWAVEPDAEIKIAGWWGRIDQLKPEQKVWTWLRLDRNKNAKSVAMIADEISEQEIHMAKTVEVEKRNAQKEFLRNLWLAEGLPGTVTFVHLFSGEMEITLDHEAMKWGRSLKYGDNVQIAISPEIKAVVKHVSPWRERTVIRLVVGELAASDLQLGQRVGLKMPALAKEIDEANYPSDIGRERTKSERVEWFLASMYCVCGVGKDICTGDFYTLASCNPNGCGAPNQTRKEIGRYIDEGKTDREIWDILVKDRGEEMTRPHLRK